MDSYYPMSEADGNLCDSSDMWRSLVKLLANGLSPTGTVRPSLSGIFDARCTKFNAAITRHRGRLTRRQRTGASGTYQDL